jgi:hypothetical protein
MARELKASGDFIAFVDAAAAFLDELTDQPKDIGHQYIEWAIERQIAMSVERLMPDIQACHKYLLENKHFENNKFSYHSGEAFVVKCKNRKRNVLCIELQNYNLLYIMEETFKPVHIRQYWKRYKLASDADKYEKEEAEKFKKGIEWAIREANNLSEEYADDILNNPYPDRPSLEWFRYKDFELGYQDKWHMTKYQSYGDCHDRGYILSYEAGFSKIQGKVDGAISTYNMCKSSAFCINNLLTTIEEDGGY